YAYYYSHDLPHTHSCPTRRSSDLANQLEGAYQEDGKGLSIADVVTAGDVKTPRRVTDGILPGEYYPSHDAIDFYHHYKEDIRLRSEEHTSELQSRFDLVCRLLLEK